MNIKEMEARSGLERSNIYFYEKEGLVTPARLENGYRDYSEEDLEMILRIKLLRSLHISLEDIRALKDGKAELPPIIKRQIELLEQEKEKADYARTLCQCIYKEELFFDHLNASKYLNGIPAIPKEEENSYFSLPKDSIPQAYHPFRRFLARTLDFFLYDSLLLIGYTKLFHVFFQDITLVHLFLISLLGLLVMLAVEPVLLHFFGTTLGKWIWGFSIKDRDNANLSFADAFIRTRQLFWHLLLFHIPIYGLFRLYGCFIECVDHQPQPWEERVLTSYFKKEDRDYRCLLSLAMCALIVFGLFCGKKSEILPPNRGELTIREFAENYNYYIDYYNYQFEEASFTEDGQWTYEPGIYSNSNSIAEGFDQYKLFNPYAEYVYETDSKGHITGVSFTLESEDPVHFEYPTLQLHLIAMALGGADKDVSFFSDFDWKIQNAVNTPPMDWYSIQLTDSDLSLHLELETKGYSDPTATQTGLTSMYSHILPLENAEEYDLRMNFSCTKN